MVDTKPLVNEIRRAVSEKSGDDKLILGIRRILKSVSGKSVEEQLAALSKPIKLLTNRMSSLQTGADKIVDAGNNIQRDLINLDPKYQDLNFKSFTPFDEQFSTIDMKGYERTSPVPYQWDTSIEPKVARAISALGGTIARLKITIAENYDKVDIDKLKNTITSIEKYLDLLHNKQETEFKNFESRKKEIDDWREEQYKELALFDKFKVLHDHYVKAINKRSFYSNVLQLAFGDQALYQFIINNKDIKSANGRIVRKYIDPEVFKDIERFKLPDYDPRITNPEVRQAQKTQGLIPGNLPGNEDIEGPEIDEEGNRTTEKMYQLVSPNYYNPLVSPLGPEKVGNTVPGLERVSDDDLRDDTKSEYDLPVDPISITEQDKGDSPFVTDFQGVVPEETPVEDELSTEDPYRDYYDQSNRGMDTESPAVRNAWVYNPNTNDFSNIEDLDNIPEHLRRKIPIDDSPNVDTMENAPIPGVDNLVSEEDLLPETEQEILPEEPEDADQIVEDEEIPPEEPEIPEDEEDEDKRQVANVIEWRRILQSRLIKRGGKVA